MNKYADWKKKNSEEFNKLNLIYAMNKEELQKEAIKNNCNIEDLYHIGFGTYVNAKDFGKFVNMNIKIKHEKQKLFSNYDFMYDAFIYQLYNHEYCITYNYDYDTAIDDLDLTIEKINISEIEVKKAFEQAKKDYQEKHNMYLK